MGAACTVAARRCVHSARNPRQQSVLLWGHGRGCTFATHRQRPKGQSALLPPSAPRVGGIRGASSAQTCVRWSSRVRCAPDWSPGSATGAQGAQARSGNLSRRLMAANSEAVGAYRPRRGAYPFSARRTDRRCLIPAGWQGGGGRPPRGAAPRRAAPRKAAPRAAHRTERLGRLALQRRARPVRR